jgi:hypothetical protein
MYGGKRSTSRTSTLCSRKESRYLLKRRLGGPQNSLTFSNKRKSLAVPGIKSQNVYYTLAIHKVTLGNNIKSEPNKT